MCLGGAFLYYLKSNKSKNKQMGLKENKYFQERNKPQEERKRKSLQALHLIRT